MKTLMGVLLMALLATGCGWPASASPASASRHSAPAVLLAPKSHHRGHTKHSPLSSPAVSIQAMDWFTPKVGWVVVGPALTDPTTPALYKTRDSGQKWTRVLYHANGGADAFGSQVFRVVALNFTDPAHGALVASLGVGACQESFAVWTTSNGGQSWSSAGTIFGSDGPVSIAQYASTTPIFFANGSCANSSTFLYEFTSRGWHETTYPGPSAASTAMGVVVIPAPAGVTLVTDYGEYSASGATGPYMYLTGVPDGSTVRWTFPGQGAVEKMAFLSPAVAWIETTRHLYQTVDQGKHWTVLRTPPVKLYTAPLVALTGTAPNPVGWYASGPDLWQSVDDGTSWSQVSTPWDR